MGQELADFMPDTEMLSLPAASRCAVWTSSILRLFPSEEPPMLAERDLMTRRGTFEVMGAAVLFANRCVRP
jgi:hypothetical protein